MNDRVAPASVLAHVDVGVLVQDREARILFANPSALALLGGTSAEVVGRTSYEPAWEAVTPAGATLEAADHPVPVAIRTGQPVRDVVVGIRTGAGHRAWLQVTAIPALDATGAVDLVYVTMTDVSQRQIQQRQLASLYEATFRSMAEGVAIHTPEGMVRSINPAAERIVGLSLAQMQGREPVLPGWRIMLPDGRPMPPAEAPSERTRVTGQPSRGVRLIVQRTEGERAWISVNTDLMIGDDDGAPLGVVATCTDITAEVRATQALEEQRALLGRVTDAVPGVLYQHVIHPDDTDEFPFMSAQALDVLGISAEAVQNASDAVWSRIHDEDRHAVRTALFGDAHVLRQATAGVETRQRFDQEFRVAAAGGGWRWVRAQSLGTLVGSDMVCHGLITDVTERRQLAEQLRAAQRQELIGVLVSGIAHNFNNMLAAILPNLERASQGASGELRQEIADALDAARSAADLVRHLMLLVRRDEPRPVEPVDVVGLVHDVVRMCRRTFDQRITLTTTTPPEARLVLGRRSELHQVILNLVINARDAVEDVADPAIDVHVQPLAHARVGITVRDNGAGMSDAARQRVGEPFFTTKTQGRGTGLGVATALGIVRELGGDLTWTSAPGAGSAFHLVLPLAPAESPRAETAPATARLQFDGQIVLVIDDEPLVRTTVARLLQGLGLTPLVAGTGREGLDVLQARDDVSVVLLDLSMPEMSGPEVLRRIAALRPSLPVLVVSGWIAEPDGLQSARGVIQKPFTSRQLADALASVLTPEA